MLLQIIHLLLAAAISYYIVGKLKWTNRNGVKVRGIDGAWTAIFGLGLGAGFVWVLGWLAGFAGFSTGLNWLVGGLGAAYLSGLAHEWIKEKPGKTGEHGKPA